MGLKSAQLSYYSLCPSVLYVIRNQQSMKEGLKVCCKRSVTGILSFAWELFFKLFWEHWLPL